MRRSLLIALTLLVLLPLGTLTGLGLRVIGNEQQAVEHQQQNLTTARLQAVDATIMAYFARLEQQLLADAHGLAKDTETLRAYLRREPQVRQVFIMSPQGERLHPPVDEPLTETEQAFLERTRDIWRNQDILYQPGMEAGEASARRCFRAVNRLPPTPNSTGGMSGIGARRLI
ncbi:MAG: hypothetical protein R3F37_06725 [Candidatus Competibacteraceae bacterium]